MIENKGENIKVSELVNEVNQEQELLQLCDKLCEDLLKVHLKQFPTLDWYGYTYKVANKYIKIITTEYGENRSVWGFINKKKFQKGATGITFECGDVLKAAGWKTPALNAPRGNLFEGYNVSIGNRKYGPDYLI